MLTETIKLYEDREDVTLTTYVIAEKGELRGQGKRPAVLICPGGAYMSCSDREAEPVALKFAAMGYHAFVLRYSVYGEGDNSFPDLSKPLEVKENCQFPNPMCDRKSNADHPRTCGRMVGGYGSRSSLRLFRRRA